VVDVADWLRGLPGGEDNRDYRADGVHFTVDGSNRVGAWMVPQILRAAGAVGPG
jgi:lysophospholipase L1-like esterase